MSEACFSQRGGLSACQSPHRPPPAAPFRHQGRLRNTARDAQPIEHLAIIAAGHATSWCHGHHRADRRCCCDQAFRECKHQRAKPARGRAASRGSCFAPRSGVGAWRWRERHDGRPQRVTAAALQPLTRTLISLQPLLGFWSRARAALRCTGPALLLLLFVGDAGGARARAQVAWRGGVALS